MDAFAITQQNLVHIAGQLLIGGSIILAVVFINLYVKSRATR